MHNRYTPLAVFLLLVIAAVLLSSGFGAGEWYYVKLNKPAWTPPSWLFGPIWSLVYLAMALAAWRVWQTGHPGRLGALTWWFLLLVQNVVWSALFFGLHRIGWAWAELGVAIGVTVLCTRAFALISRQAAGLLVPYLVWLLFLWALNFSMWSINGGPLSFA